ncbi:CHAP domain containing protein [uncultured Caudovirales phage]|uniref:CHAP domain containing protein n=1 Tax=uncultured Caudovirales phage TaxID=2100421 RepID=A0A6J5QHB9_9CAUD|nr:CHAP domain containing protein [uncultured Caudovirales phage]CAB4212991.1 CHAP domain containing protein [uncultured Caudovirales phage]
MSVDDFISTYNGVHIDEDGYYGAQCWDVSARYAREVVGCPSFPTGSGGAEGIYRLFQEPIPQYFVRIANDPKDPDQLPQKGDVAVWQASFSPPYGHTALVISADSSGPTVLEQNGNNPGGVSYIKKRGWTGVSGWLRPKIQGGLIMNEESGAELYRTGLHRDPESPDAARQWNGQTSAQAIRSLRASAEWQGTNSTLVNFPKVVAERDAANGALNQVSIERDQLKSQVLTLIERPTQEVVNTLNNKVDELVKVQNIKDGEISRLNQENESLKAQVGNNTKWETLKALLRELIGKGV